MPQLPLPYVVTDPPTAEQIQGNFEALAKQFPLSRKSMSVEAAHILQPADLLNGWVNYDTTAFQAALYCKDPMGIVHLEGLVRNGAAAPSTIFVLPAGYRPAVASIFAVISNNTIGRVDVAPTGNVLLASGTNPFVSLSGITFKQEA